MNGGYDPSSRIQGVNDTLNEEARERDRRGQEEQRQDDLLVTKAQALINYTANELAKIRAPQTMRFCRYREYTEYVRDHWWSGKRQERRREAVDSYQGYKVVELGHNDDAAEYQARTYYVGLVILSDLQTGLVCFLLPYPLKTPPGRVADSDPNEVELKSEYVNYKTYPLNEAAKHVVLEVLPMWRHRAQLFRSDRNYRDIILQSIEAGAARTLRVASGQEPYS